MSLSIEERDELLELLASYGAHCIAVGQSGHNVGALVDAEARMHRAHVNLTATLDEITVFDEVSA